MNRLGFHYYPDTLHYRQDDLKVWLPRLRRLGAKWLVLQAPAQRALPERFLDALLEAEIQPLLHFHLRPDQSYHAADLEVLFKSYARWGVQHIALYDRPNLRRAWDDTTWVQTELVERFIDRYLPLATACLEHQLTPVFPPLAPGGDYWDMSFLKAALQSLQRRGQTELLSKLVLGAYADASQNPLDWGAGGPERWPGGLPYYTPPNEQDQRGFRIFDWYSAVARAVLNAARPIFLFGMRAAADEAQTPNLLAMAHLLNDDPVAGQEPVPDTVVGGAFWLLTTTQADQRNLPLAWFRPDGSHLPVVDQLFQQAKSPDAAASPPAGESATIAHYLLLPSYEWGIPAHYLEAIWPYVKKHQPTVGFSLQEATQARRVTVVGSENEYSEAELRTLRARGCIVERANGDGTNLAISMSKLV